MIPMKMYGVTIHEMTAGEAVGVFAVAGAIAVGAAVAVFLAVRSRRNPPRS